MTEVKNVDTKEQERETNLSQTVLSLECNNDTPQKEATNTSYVLLDVIDPNFTVENLQNEDSATSRDISVDVDQREYFYYIRLSII